MIAAHRRDLRVIGLGAWAVGCAGLVVYLAPHGHHRLFAAAAVLGLIAAAAGGALVRPRPVAARARDARVRAGTDPGPRRLDAGEPAPAALRRRRRRRDRARVGALRRRRAASRELGPLANPLALFVAWEGLTFLWTKDVRQGAIELLFFVLPFGLLAVVLARLPWSRAWVLTLYVQLAGWRSCSP